MNIVCATRAAWMFICILGLVGRLSYGAHEDQAEQPLSVEAGAEADGVNTADQDAAAGRGHMHLVDRILDTPFDQFVDITLLGRAIADVNPSLLADVGLQLAEGERVLMRPHRAITAERVLLMAADLAVQTGDQDTLARLERGARHAGRADAADRIEALRQLAAQPRSLESQITIQVDSTDQESFLVLKGYLNAIREAKLLGSKDATERVHAMIEDETTIDDELRGRLLKLVEESRSATADTSEDEQEVLLTLTMLAADSRSLTVNGLVWSNPIVVTGFNAPQQARTIAEQQGGRLPTVAEFQAASPQLRMNPQFNKLLHVFFTATPGIQWNVPLNRSHGDRGIYIGFDLVTSVRDAYDPGGWLPPSGDDFPPYVGDDFPPYVGDDFPPYIGDDGPIAFMRLDPLIGTWRTEGRQVTFGPDGTCRISTPTGADQFRYRYDSETGRIEGTSMSTGRTSVGQIRWRGDNEFDWHSTDRTRRYRRIE